MNAVISFDTLKYANRLKAADVPPKQAELQAEVMKEVLETAFQAAELATKSDLRELRAEMKADLQEAIDKVRLEIEGLKGETADLRTHVLLIRKDMEAITNTLVIRMASIMGVGIGMTAAIVALIQKFL